MALASLLYTDGSLRPIPPEKAVDVWNVLNGHGEPTEAQAKFLPSIKDVFIPPSFRAQAKGYEQAHGLAPQQVDTSHLTHTGIEQGMTQALPTGDR